MPLSHVCVWDADIGYKRISLESACKMYPNGASAKSGYFVCELCAQNVLLTAPGVNVRHFRHDPSSPNKECDERQAHFDPLYGRRLRNLNSHLMPLRITVAKESFALQMGFFCPPDSEARCDKIRITTNSGKAYEYSFERIERGGTTYLNIGETPSREYNLEYINAAADLVKFWPSKVPGISSSGSFFDERTGQILPSGAKAYFGDSYYLLQSKPLGDPPTGLEVSEVLRTKTGSLATWYLYKIQIKRFSEITAKFFLKYAIFLTEHPTKFYPIWPAYIKEPYWISLCKVNRPDKNRDIWMLRLADAVGGVLVAPYFDKQKEQIHDNRLFVFCDDGPTEPGRIGFWEWEEFESEPGRWKTTSTYMEQASPVEVIVLDEVSNIEGVIMSLKSGLHCITGLTQRTARRGTLRAVHCFAFSDLRLFLHFVSVYKIFPNSLQSVFLGELSCKVRIPCFRCIFQPLIILRIAQIPFGGLFVRVQRTLIAFVHSLLCTVKFLHDLFVLRL